MTDDDVPDLGYQVVSGTFPPNSPTALRVIQGGGGATSEEMRMIEAEERAFDQGWTTGFREAVLIIGAGVLLFLLWRVAQ